MITPSLLIAILKMINETISRMDKLWLNMPAASSAAATVVTATTTTTTTTTTEEDTAMPADDAEEDYSTTVENPSLNTGGALPYAPCYS
jgi:hypothetical protein